MNENEYADWINELVDDGVYPYELGEDFKRQRSLFEENFRRRIDDGDPELAGAVGYVDDVPVEAPSARLLVFQASQERPGAAIYFESLSSEMG